MGRQLAWFFCQQPLTCSSCYTRSKGQHRYAPLYMPLLHHAPAPRHTNHSSCRGTCANIRNTPNSLSKSTGPLCSPNGPATYTANAATWDMLQCCGHPVPTLTRTLPRPPAQPALAMGCIGLSRHAVASGKASRESRTPLDPESSNQLAPAALLRHLH